MKIVAISGGKCLGAGDLDASTFQEIAEPAPFRAWPTQGIILPHQPGT